MIRIHDSRTGRAEPVRPARRGELHICLVAPATGGRLGGLRAALLADLVRRAGERHRLLVTTWRVAPEPGAGYEEFNIHPPQDSTEFPAHVDVAITPAGTQPSLPGTATHWLRPAPVTGDGLGPGAAPDGSPSGAGPLALRLALMRHHHQQAATLDEAATAASDRALGRWRELVAGWACSPSKPMCAQYVQDVLTAFDDDLNTPAALGTLQRLADDQDLQPGAKFESFARLDHLLGLDLAREVGR